MSFCLYKSRQGLHSWERCQAVSGVQGACALWLPWQVIRLPSPFNALLCTVLLNQPDQELRVSCDGLQNCFLSFSPFVREIVNCSSSEGFYSPKERGMVNESFVCVSCLVSFPSKGELKHSYKEQLLLKFRVRKRNRWDRKKGRSQWECSQLSQHENV